MAYSRSAHAPADPREFAARLRRLAVAGAIVAAGVISALVAGDVVGVTARASGAGQQPGPAVISGNSPYYGGDGQSSSGSYYGTGTAGGGFFGGAPNPGLGAAGNQAPLLGSGGS